MLLRCETLEPPMSQLVKIPRCANDFGTVGLPQRTDVLVTGLARGVRAMSGHCLNLKMKGVLTFLQASTM
jgi:hypothetical protein